MAFALKFDGVNDYATLASSNAMHQTRAMYSLIIRLRINSYGTSNIATVYGRAADGFGSIRISDGQVIVRYRSNNATITGTGLTADGLFHTVEIRRSIGGSHSMFVDGVPVGTNPVQTATTSEPVDIIGTTNTSASGNFAEFDLEYLQLYNADTGGSLVFDWDATSSSHASGTPVLDELISSNDATGVNMPTDGSAWIDLDGGGISIPVIMNQLRNQGIN